MNYIPQESESSSNDELKNYKIITNSQKKKIARKKAGTIHAPVGKSLDDSQYKGKKVSEDKEKTTIDAEVQKSNTNTEKSEIPYKKDVYDHEKTLNNKETLNDEEIVKDNEPLNDKDKSANREIVEDEEKKTSSKHTNTSHRENKNNTMSISDAKSDITKGFGEKALEFFDDSISYEKEIMQTKKNKNIEIINYNTKAKRTKKNWTDEEVEFLKSGIKKFSGEMNLWSKILKTYDFNNRTTTDLKDKYRNLIKKTSYHTHKNKPFCLADDRGEPVTNYSGDVRVFYQKFPYDAAVRIANYNNFTNNLDFNVCIKDRKYPLYTYTAICQDDGTVIVRAKKATYK